MIWDLVTAIAQNPKQVVVTKVLEKPLSFEIRVSLIDYELVLSKLTAIKTLAAAFAGLVETQGPLIHVTPVGGSTASQDKA